MYTNTEGGFRLMFMIDPMSRQPVYEQIIRQMERFILSLSLIHISEPTRRS